jgi:hypothetical protein
MVKRLKPKNYNRSVIASFQHIFHITCNLAIYLYSCKFMCKLYNHISINYWKKISEHICNNIPKIFISLSYNKVTATMLPRK